ncbi:MAG: OmpL47-type beta-barrel domain-containing protein [Chloroflexota bacterium]
MVFGLRSGIAVILFATVIAAVTIVLFTGDDAHAANVTIDSFEGWDGDNNASVCPGSVPLEDAAVQTFDGIIGGERDFFAQTSEDLDDETDCMFISVGDVQPQGYDEPVTAFDAWAQGSVDAEGQVQWDGPDDDGETLDPTGLGGVDLTDGGLNDTLYIYVLENNSGIDELTTTVYTDGSNASTFTLDLPSFTGLSSQGFVMPMSDFVASEGTGADFTDVGAITWDWEVVEGASGPKISVFDARVLDDTAPVVSAQVSGDEGDNGWFIENPTVTITADDPESAVHLIEYRIGEGAVQTYNNPFQISQDGEFEVEFRATNDHGFTSDWESIDILVDTEAPQGSIDFDPESPNSNGWYNEPVDVTFTCTDDGSGFQAGDTTQDTQTFGQDVDNGFIQILCTDQAGNEYSDSATINIDLTNPTIELHDSYTFEEGTIVQVDVESVSDPLSGIESIRWDLDGDGTFEESYPLNLDTGDGPDTLTFDIQAIDNAGNETVEEVVITIENVDPEIDSVTVNGNEVIVSASDQGNDELSYEFDCDDDGQYEVSPQSSNTTECPLGTSRGEYQVNVRVTDGDGGSDNASAIMTVEAPLCANRYNGDLRMPRGDTCASTEMLVSLPTDAPLDVCINRYNGDLRYSRTGTCASTETAVTLPAQEPLPVCVNRYNGDLRVSHDGQTCGATEYLREIGYSGSVR